MGTCCKTLCLSLVAHIKTTSGAVWPKSLPLAVEGYPFNLISYFQKRRSQCHQ